MLAGVPSKRDAPRAPQTRFKARTLNNAYTDLKPVVFRVSPRVTASVAVVGLALFEVPPYPVLLGRPLEQSRWLEGYTR